MTSTRKLGYTLGLGLVGALLAPADANAYSYDTCNGCPVIWRSNVAITRHRASIPDTGDANSAYWNAIHQWNDRINRTNNFKVTNDTSADHGDSRNDVQIVNRADIDGANGLTISNVGMCFIGCNDIDSSDVMVANDLPLGIMGGDFLDDYGRVTFVHEFGHFFGLNHDNGPYSVMGTTAPHPITGGSEPATIWANDAHGMDAMYGTANSTMNLLASSQGASNGVAYYLDPYVWQPICRGQTYNVRFVIENNGRNASGLFYLETLISTTAPVDGYTAPATSTNVWTISDIGGFSGATYTLPVTVPSGQPNGLYYIYLKLDPYEYLGELRENDNITVSALGFDVNC